jgi:hypothetical protein
MTTGRINQVTVEPPKQPVALGDESATRAFRSFYPPLNSSLSHSDIESVLSPSQRQLQMGQNPSQRTASLTYAACIELGPSARTATRGQAVYDKCGTRPQSATGLNRANGLNRCKAIQSSSSGVSNVAKQYRVQVPGEVTLQSK